WRVCGCRSPRIGRTDARIAEIESSSAAIVRFRRLLVAKIYGGWWSMLGGVYCQAASHKN
ncbi:hypothetical protein, partial [Actinoplanes italicus]|uniref:hypothetical protein n=1 Tax=Actinoplanes italicus TaxID=113567 RepID=UPI001943BECD